MEKKRFHANKFKHGLIQKLSKIYPKTSGYIKIKSLKRKIAENVFKDKNS